jgi:hypothetical protein
MIVEYAAAMASAKIFKPAVEEMYDYTPAGEDSVGLILYGLVDFGVWDLG